MERVGRGRRARRWVWIFAGGALLAALAPPVALRIPVVQALAKQRAQDALQQRFGSARIDGDIRVDWRLRLTLGPVTLGEAGRLTIDRVDARIALPPLLQGRLEIAEVGLRRPVLRLTAGGEALSQLRELVKADPPNSPPPVAKDSSKAAPAPSIAVTDAVLLLDGDARAPSRVGPVHLSLSRSAEATVVDLLHPGGDGRAQLQLSRAKPLSVSVRVDAWPVQLLPGDLPAWPQLGASLRVDGTLGLHWEGTDGPGRLSVELEVADGRLDDPRLASEPVAPISAGVRGTVSWPRGMRLEGLSVPELTVWAGPGRQLQLQARARITDGPEPQVHAEAKLVPVTHAQLLAALPASLRPPADAPGFQGTVHASLKIDGALERPSSWDFDGGLELTDARTKTRAVAPRLEGSVRYFAPASADAGGWREVVVGPENPSFVPIAEVPDVVLRAITTSEDASFFDHSGFDFAEAWRSAVDAIAGRRYRGASTLTQQLAKNLFLSRERTLSRKVQEALLTVALEASVPKARLMEIYVNAVEWGPGIFGIGAASQHYFGKPPRALSLEESAFLATLLPSPGRYHAYHLRGMTENANKRLAELLRKMAHEAVVTPLDAERAIATPLAFSSPCTAGSPTAPASLGEGEADELGPGDPTKGRRAVQQR